MASQLLEKNNPLNVKTDSNKAQASIFYESVIFPKKLRIT